MNELDETLAELFVDDEGTDAERAAFAAAVQRRVARQRLFANAVTIGAPAVLCVAVVALVAVVPEITLYPVQEVAGLLSSPAAAIVCLLGSVGAAWWTRYGDV